MTIHEASQQLRFQLFHVYDDREAGNIADLVMEHITGWTKIDRVVNKSVPLSARQQEQLEAYTRTLLAHTPLQYVLQEAWFYGMKLYIDENVLIPRPETEELADWIIKDNTSSKFEVQSSQAGVKNVLDIGTGSGCIPLAIKKKLPHFEVHAIDISEGALQVAKKNAAAQQLTIHFQLLDILSVAARQSLSPFDIIVSNPPYIPQSDKTSMAPNVLQYEPHLALFVADNDPLLFYKAIADFAITHLKKNGYLYLEIHEDMAQAVISLYRQKRFATIELRKDLQGRDRMVKVGGLVDWLIS
jgi:release factor glutamine methyltransferase